MSAICSKFILRSLIYCHRERGALIVGDLETALRQIEGVSRETKIQEASSKYGQYTYSTMGIPNVGKIDAIRVADAGYMKLDESVLQINYIVNSDNE